MIPLDIRRPTILCFMTIKEFAKKTIKSIPIAFTQNQKYDKQTKQIIEESLHSNSNCIDVGAHKGEILDLIIDRAPKGNHFAFEPIPEMFEELNNRYSSDLIKVYDCALSYQKGSATFNHVVSNPSYSGLKKRKYDHPNEIDQQIRVETDLLDNIIPSDISIDFIKIDVEGGEFDVLKGAVETIKRCKPIVIFEHGLGASEFYNANPRELFQYFDNIGMNISLLKSYLNNKNTLDQVDFERQYNESLNYYFIAFPKK